MVRNLTMAAVMILALATFAACSGGGGSGIPAPNPSEGVVGGPCFADGTCNEGLVCKYVVCVAPPAVGEDGGACRADGTCNEALVCTDDTCVVPSAGEEGGVCLEDGTCNEGLFCNAETKLCGTVALERVGPLPVPRLKCPIGMAFIEGGTFQMGSESGRSNEKPVHSVTVSDFCMDRTEFTYGDQDAYVAEGLPLPGEYAAKQSKNPVYLEKTQPVIDISWAEAKGFCENLGKRLPTEAEWEYAARGGGNGFEYGTADGTLHPNGDNACWNWDHPEQKQNWTCRTKLYDPNPLGLYDMSGNVWEWVADWYGPYSADAIADPTGPGSGTNKVVRGGSWDGNAPASLRAAGRYGIVPGFRGSVIGFRCVAAPRTP